MRLIDADKLREDVLDLPNCYNGFSDTYDKAMVIDLVDEQPTIEAEPIRHGKWKLMTIFNSRRGRRYCASCSECGQLIPDGRSVRELPIWNYCPNCGAEMDLPEIVYPQVEGITPTVVMMDEVTE